MIILDVTGTSFIEDVEAEEANAWMNDNVGAIEHDDCYCSYGKGWRLVYEHHDHRWILKIDKEDKAVLFQLRWC